MFTVYAREWKANRMIRETTVTDSSKETRTHKVFHALTEVCRTFDLPEPIWLDKNIRDFKAHAKCRFDQDSFVEEIEFDSLEFMVAEEDAWWEVSG